MRFETSNSVPPHLNRRLQLRMLGFVALIGVFMFVMGMFQADPKKRNANAPLPGSPERPLFKVEDPDHPTLKPDEFWSPPDNAEKPNERDAWKEPRPGDADGNRAPADTGDVLDQEIARLETGFDRGMLRRVKDNTLGIRREESDAYYRLLFHASRVNVAELEKAGATDVLYINLMTEPERYRGESVTIQGELWRLYEFQAGPNDFGLKTLYEAWIFTPDSDKQPYRVVCTDLPRELEPGENLRKQVRTTGYFFKREGYPSNGGLHVAPTILAQRIVPYRLPNATPSTEAINSYMIGLISAVGLAFLVTLVSFAISDRRAARVSLLRELNSPRPSFEGIDAPATLTVAESLRQLEEQEWESETRLGENDDATTALHARDRVASRPANPAAPATTAEEAAERRRSQTQSVQAWTARQTRRDGISSFDRDKGSAGPGLDTQRGSGDLSDEAAAETELEDVESDANGDSRVPPVTGNGLSKLAAWENEIQQLSTHDGDRNDRLTVEQLAAQAELQRDRTAREREWNDRFRRQRVELDSERELNDQNQDRDSK